MSAAIDYRDRAASLTYRNKAFIDGKFVDAASAGPNFHAAMRSGKFHGTTAATTPSGSRVIMASALRSDGAISS